MRPLSGSRAVPPRPWCGLEDHPREQSSLPCLVHRQSPAGRHTLSKLGITTAESDSAIKQGKPYLEL
eukprot:2078581-Pleurochrysis_carterae.AAC.1